MKEKKALVMTCNIDSKYFVSSSIFANVIPRQYEDVLRNFERYQLNEREEYSN